MDYFGLVREAWDLIRRERGLWGLASVEALHYLLLWTLTLAMTVPMLMISVAAMRNEGDMVFAGLADSLAFWLASNYVTLMIVLGTAFIAWLAAAVLSVAAQGGVVAQTRAALASGHTSTAAGLGTGFRLWARSASLLALPALPSLLYYLALAVLMQLYIAGPVAAGQRPDFLRLEAAFGALSPLTVLIGLVGLPLGVLVTVALRSAVLEDTEWRPAFVVAWEFVKRHFTQVALTFLVLYLVAFLAALAAELVLGLIAAVIAIVAFAVGANTAAGAGVTIGVLGAIVLVALFAMIAALLMLLNSVTWTLLWMRLRWAPREGMEGQ